MYATSGTPYERTSGGTANQHQQHPINGHVYAAQAGTKDADAHAKRLATLAKIERDFATEMSRSAAKVARRLEKVEDPEVELWRRHAMAVEMGVPTTTASGRVSVGQSDALPHGPQDADMVRQQAFEILKAEWIAETAEKPGWAGLRDAEAAITKLKRSMVEARARFAERDNDLRTRINQHVTAVGSLTQGKAGNWARSREYNQELTKLNSLLLENQQQFQRQEVTFKEALAKQPVESLRRRIEAMSHELRSLKYKKKQTVVKAERKPRAAEQLVPARHTTSPSKQQARSTPEQSGHTSVARRPSDASSTESPNNPGVFRRSTIPSTPGKQADWPYIPGEQSSISLAKQATWK